MSKGMYKDAFGAQIELSDALDLPADVNVTYSKLLMWVSGNTYPLRDALKNAGFKWSAKRRAWWKPVQQVTTKEPPVNPETDDYAVTGNVDGKPVVIAECHHESLI